MFSIIFKNHFPFGLKLLIDFFSVTLIFYLMNQIIDLPIVYSNLITYLIFPFLSVLILSILNTYNSMYRYLNINDILRLVIGISLNSIIFFIYWGNFEKIL